jgi:hypothetical protein
MSQVRTVSRRTFLEAAALGVGIMASSARASADETRKFVLIAGSPSHGPMEHEFSAGVQLLKKCLDPVSGVEVSAHFQGWPKDETVLERADGILCYADGGSNHPFLRGNHLETISRLMKKGVGLMCAHYGVEVPKDLGAKEFRDWIGGCYETGWSCNPIWTPEFNEFPQHAITRGVRPFAIRDEWYFNMRFRPDMEGITPILSAKPSDQVRKGPYVAPRGPYPHIVADSGRVETMMWAVERADGGRGVGFTGGHFHRNWLDNNFRKVVLNALLWIAKAEVPRDGVESSVSEAEIAQNLDPKPARK